jgi:hypothetical protein
LPASSASFEPTPGDPTIGSCTGDPTTSSCSSISWTSALIACLPQAHIEIADHRWADYQARMNAPGWRTLPSTQIPRNSGQPRLADGKPASRASLTASSVASTRVRIATSTIVIPTRGRLAACVIDVARHRFVRKSVRAHARDQRPRPFLQPHRRPHQRSHRERRDRLGICWLPRQSAYAPSSLRVIRSSCGVGRRRCWPRVRRDETCPSTSCGASLPSSVGGVRCPGVAGSEPSRGPCPAGVAAAHERAPLPPRAQRLPRVQAERRAPSRQ